MSYYEKYRRTMQVGETSPNQLVVCTSMSPPSLHQVHAMDKEPPPVDPRYQPLVCSSHQGSEKVKVSSILIFLNKIVSESL